MTVIGVVGSSGLWSWLTAMGSGEVDVGALPLILTNELESASIYTTKMDSTLCLWKSSATAK
jgi:hypothetical protein